MSDARVDAARSHREPWKERGDSAFSTHGMEARYVLALFSFCRTQSRSTATTDPSAIAKETVREYGIFAGPPMFGGGCHCTEFALERQKDTAIRLRESPAALSGRLFIGGVEPRAALEASLPWACTLSPTPVRRTISVMKGLPSPSDFRHEMISITKQLPSRSSCRHETVADMKRFPSWEAVREYGMFAGPPMFGGGVIAPSLLWKGKRTRRYASENLLPPFQGGF